MGLYLIQNCGCDDTTYGLVEFTEEQLKFFTEAVENLNRGSSYGCQPTIHVYKVGYTDFEEIGFKDEPPEEWGYTVVWLNGHAYRPRGYTWDLMNGDNKVI